MNLIKLRSFYNKKKLNLFKIIENPSNGMRQSIDRDNVIKIVDRAL